jgi:segregation and condensation protein A
VLGRDTFVRGALPETVEGPAPLAPVGVFKLLEAFQRILERAKTVIDHQIEFERLSITDRINQLVDRLRQFGALSFDALFDGQRTRAELIVTFLALLEMTRLRLTNVQQDHALAPIMIELAVTDGEQAIDSDAADYLNRDASPVQTAPFDVAAGASELAEPDDGAVEGSLDDSVDWGALNESEGQSQAVEEAVAAEAPPEPETMEPDGLNETEQDSQAVEQGVAGAKAPAVPAAGDEEANKQSESEKGSE